MSGVHDFPVPNPARIYDYLLGGKDYFPPDREAAEKLIAAYPEARTLARANRRFLTRAVWYLAEYGIGQYIDLGTGLPTSPNVHEVARQVRPAGRAPGSSTSTTTRWSPCTVGCYARPVTG
jgi:S-adenosyl methyltransferase